ncbi:MAG: hypothetical protein H6739_08005 [Alphaproteobacteria bacterium]|nr:hypothetical protein [Alphaproteobacteria bacterium]
MANPYLRAWARRRAHARQERRLREAAAWLLPLGALALAGPLIRPVFMDWLGSAALAEGAAGLGLRLGLVLCGAMSLRTYVALVRGEERPILDPHPADTPALLRYLLLRTAWEHAALPLGAAVVALPVLWSGEALAWALIAAVAAGGWAVGLLSGFTVHLASVWAAESPALSLLLNLLRGSNPRLQAALIYAPGVVLALGGAAVYGASMGAQRVLEGQLLGAVALLLPIAVGGLAWLPAGRLAERYHYRATVILAEIDAAYEGTEDPEEARRVYLEWAVRYLPAAARPFVLRELRHGWRGLRAWVTGAWGLGLIAFLPAWSEDPLAPGRAALVAGAGMVVVGTVGLRLAATDPLWLEQVLPWSRGPVLAARGLTVFAWLQGAVAPPVLALAIRQGAGVAGPVLGALEVLAVALAVLATLISPLRSKGAFLYLALGLACWAGVALAVTPWGEISGGGI